MPWFVTDASETEVRSGTAQFDRVLGLAARVLIGAEEGRPAIMHNGAPLREGLAIASLGFLAVPSLLNAAMNRQVAESHLNDVGIPTNVINLTPAQLSAVGRLPGEVLADAGNGRAADYPVPVGGTIDVMSASGAIVRLRVSGTGLNLAATPGANGSATPVLRYQ